MNEYGREDIQTTCKADEGCPEGILQDQKQGVPDEQQDTGKTGGHRTVHR